MEMVATVYGDKYVISSLSKNSFLVSGNAAEYIIYKSGGWHCADEIPPVVLRALGQAIDEQMPKLQPLSLI